MEIRMECEMLALFRGEIRGIDLCVISAEIIQRIIPHFGINFTIIDFRVIMIIIAYGMRLSDPINCVIFW